MTTSTPTKGARSAAPDGKTAHPWDGLVEIIAAELTETVYSVVLRHGPVDSWVDLKLELWKVLSDTLQQIGQGLSRALRGAKTQRDGRPVEPEQVKPVLQRLVTYYGLDEDGEPTSRRFLSYKIVAGPGPSEDSGLASIVTLALSNPGEGCESCQKFHTVEKGGAAAVMAAAIRYLDAYHEGNRLQKVESDIRG
jgi:hypothetical protein